MDRKFAALFAVSFCIILGIGWLAYASTTELFDAYHWVDHTHEVLEALGTLNNDLSDVQKYARTVVIGGDEKYLENYQGAVKDVPRVVDRIAFLTQDNPVQIRNIARLKKPLADYLGFYDGILGGAKPRKRVKAPAFLREGMDHLNGATAIVEGMVREENALLAVRNNVEEGQQKRIRLVYTALILLASAAVIGALLGYTRRLSLKLSDAELLLEKDEITAQFLESLPIGVFVATSDGKPYYRNKAGRDLLGRDLKAGHDPRPLTEQYEIRVAGTDEVYPRERSPLYMALKGQRTVREDLEILHPDGKRIPIEVSGTPIYSSDGVLTFASTTFWDISERKAAIAAALEAQARLTEAYVRLDENRREQLQLKDRLLSHVSHELRTPLAAIHQFVSLPLDGLAGPIDERTRDYLQVALRNVGQLQAMINDLLQASKADADKVAISIGALDLGALAAETLRSMHSPASEHGVDLVVDFPACLPQVRGDSVRIRQVFINLVDNALKFTPTGGSVRVVGVDDGSEPGFVRVDVIDTGKGIAPEALDKVFNRLFQAGEAEEVSRRGLGLGLYLCRDLVTRHGGKIWAESRLGSGSSFHFTLPKVKS
jgi:signal transduction histidine kinase